LGYAIGKVNLRNHAITLKTRQMRAMARTSSCGEQLSTSISKDEIDDYAEWEDAQRGITRVEDEPDTVADSINPLSSNGVLVNLKTSNSLPPE
jgi:transcription elongation factor Elf1